MIKETLLTSLEKFVEHFAETKIESELKAFIEDNHTKKGESHYFNFSYLMSLQKTLQNKTFGTMVQFGFYNDHDYFLDDMRAMFFSFHKKKINIERYFNFVTQVDKFIANIPGTHNFQSLTLLMKVLKEFLLDPKIFNELGTMHIVAYKRITEEGAKVERFAKGINAIVSIYTVVAVNNYEPARVKEIQQVIMDFDQNVEASTKTAPHSAFHATSTTTQEPSPPVAGLMQLNNFRLV